MTEQAKIGKKTGTAPLRAPWGRYLLRHYPFYLMLLPGLAYILVFKILPMYGIVLAFKDYNMFIGSSPFTSIFESEWVGLKYFRQLAIRSDFWNAFRNTILISTYKIIFLFPAPIVFAIMLNELSGSVFKKAVQQLTYLPHFLSWSIIAGLFVSLLGSTGLVNRLIEFLGFGRVKFLMDNAVFRSVLVFTDGWKSFGWGSIVYLAAIAGLEQDTYEAATVDGAGRFQKMLYITLPGLAPTIVLMLILRLGNILQAGFDQVFVLYSPVVYDVADIIDTYVYRIGLGQLNFSFGTAVGLANSLISMVLVLLSNYFARKWSGKGIW